MPADFVHAPVIAHAEHFGSEQAREGAAHLGMWVFLATEALLFAALFCGYALYRQTYTSVFDEARTHMAVGLGTLNTFVLIGASIFVAMSIWAVREYKRRLSFVLLLGAAALGLAFLGVKALEYAQHIREGALPGAWYHAEGLTMPGTSMFYTLYYLMTGLHALHVAVGVGLLLTMAVRVVRGGVNPSYLTPLELSGMYWHFVDVVWLFLWPMLYLA